MSRRLLLLLLIVVACTGRAVTPGDGPGGVGTTDGTSELEVWVKADSLGLANGAAVASWGDASGHGRALVQGNAAVQPVFVANALNGKPVVRFTADYFGSHVLPSSNNEFTIVAVVKPTSIGAYHNIVDGVGGVRPMLWIDPGAKYEFNFTSGAVTPTTGGNDLVFAVKRNSGAQISQVYLNGPAVTASGPNAFGVAATATYTFFQRANAQAYTGDVAELILYSTALTTEEIGKVGYYLQQKYALGNSFPPTSVMFTGYQKSPAIYGVNVAIEANAPLLAGGTPTGYAVAPALPSGLTLNTTTGVISGTPTTVAPQSDYTITATFAAQPSASTTLPLAVVAPALVGYSRQPAIFTQNRAGTPVTPVVRGGPVTGFTISPALPAGLALHPTTGVISGTPTVTAASANYTVTAKFSGYPDATFAVSLEVLAAATTLEISELMAENDTNLADGDGAYSDWIEIHNYGATAIDLEGWALTDEADRLDKWKFPSKILAAGAYLVVFASDDAHTDPAGYLHTNFKLSATGEYLALVQPNGTIAHAYAPAYPALPIDVSYGTPDRVAYGTYSTPTPGAANGFFNDVTTRVIATPAGRTFAAPMNVTLALSTPGGFIRYTIDGTAPGATSPIYTGAIAVSGNTRIRARVFQSRKNPGPETSEFYMRLGADLQTFSSNLPLVFLSTDGTIAGTTSPTLTGANTVFIEPNAGTGRATADGAPTYAGRGGLRLRGRSSSSFPQKQYKFSTWDSRDREVNAPLLGLANSSDWVLYAPYTDKAMVRNALAYEMWGKLGWPTMQRRFVEVFINEGGAGNFAYSHYAGVYMLVEAIRLERLDLSGPQTTNITGGFIAETGNADSQDFSTTDSGRAVAHAYADPNATQLSATQKTWLRDAISNFEQALYGPNFTHPVTGLHYREYTNVASQVDYKIAREWSRNFDGGSTYSSIPRGGELTMGPLWDYNWAFGNVNYAEGGDIPGYRTDGWNRSFTANVNGWAPWWLRFEQDPDWWQQFIDRWTELREGVLSDSAVNAEIAALTGPLAQEAAARNFARWPQLGVFTVVSPPGYETRTTYQSEVDYLKTWLQQRSAWIDAQFPKRPAFSRAPGAVTVGSTVTLTTTPGETIFYTTNGADPRLPGGGVHASALSVASGGSVTVNSSVVLRARARNGTTWGAPATAAYVTGLPASGTNLIVSEIAYHPAGPTVGELASMPSVTDEDFEFLELRNVGAAAVDLTGAAFVDGIEFTFGPGTTLAPGTYLVVVKNAAAFALRHGASATVAGVYAGNLQNGGDTLILRAANGAEILHFTYSDTWSTMADGGGYTLVARNDSAVSADYSSAAAWGLSATAGGSPGAANGPVFSTDFALWRSSRFSAVDLANPLRSGPLADPDGDGLVNFLEFALAGDPLKPLDFAATHAVREGGELVFSFTRPRQALGVTYGIEQATVIPNWTPVGATLEIVGQTAETETVRVRMSVGATGAKFLRVRVVGE